MAAGKSAVTNLPEKTDTPAPELPAEINSAASLMDDLAREFGTGLEEVTAKDQIISRIAILQPLSPQLQTNTDAKPGEICDTGLGIIYPSPIVLLPVHFTKQWLQWGPRGSGRGLVKIHDTAAIMDHTTEDDKRRNILPNKDYVIETSQLYVINLTGKLQKGFIAFQSTQLKKVRQLLTNAMNERITDSRGREFIPPLFYRTYSFGSVPESNAQGNWWGWKIDNYQKVEELPNWQALLLEVKNFRSALTTGHIKADMSDIAAEAQAGGHVIDNDDNNMNRTLDDEIPF
jgi:hypothetical protein